ncbi:MAG: T9SS type A sorting domain-containing protein [Bacteroidota bacterium]
MRVQLLLFLTVSTCMTYAQNIYTIAGNGTSGYSGDGGLATMAKVNFPGGMAVDASGNLIIADEFNNRIRMVSTSGIITTIVGTGVAGSGGDGGAATAAQLNLPFSVTLDGAGNLYIAEYGGHRIRKVNASGIITTVAGTGTAGFSGDGGSATLAQLNNPTGVAIDGLGNLYIADWNNNRIRMVNTSGVMTTVAGTGAPGFSGDGGPANVAQLNKPIDVDIDLNSNIYITEQNNNRVRLVNSLGVISTYVGTGSAGYGGDGGNAVMAQINSPAGSALDTSGNLYIADFNNNRIRKVDAWGTITTFAGTGTAGFSGDGGPANLAQLNLPNGVIVSLSGCLYITDNLNHRIREVLSSSCTSPLEVTQFNTVFTLSYVNPNPLAATATILFPQPISKGEFRIYNLQGDQIMLFGVSGSSCIVDREGLPAGIYFYQIVSREGILTSGKLVIID